MFTVEQIKAAHSKVKSGADFPAYIRDVRDLGVISYESFVSDGHTEYHGAGDHAATIPPRYEAQPIAGFCNADQFKGYLLAHQQGKSDYTTFCRQCAETGIDKWKIDMKGMTCTYFDKAGNEILVEQIPV